MRSQSGAQGKWGFTGAEYDPDAKGYHMGARWYDPGLGRWWAADPESDNFNPLSLNLYTYVYNSPLTLVDKNGRDACIAMDIYSGGLGGCMGSASLIFGAVVRAAAAVAIGAAGATLLNAAAEYQAEKEAAGYVKPAIEHMKKLLGPNGKDPRRRNDWLKDLKKALSNIKKRVDSLKKSLRDILKDLYKNHPDVLKQKLNDLDELEDFLRRLSVETGQDWLFYLFP